MTTTVRARPAPDMDWGLVFDIQRFSIHDGPGIRTAVFLKGCPMRCEWCANPESQARRPELMWSRRDQRSNTVGDWMSPADVMAVVLRDKAYYDESGGGMTLTGGEFMLQPEFSMRLIDEAAKHGITVVGETSGLAQPKTFARLVERLDMVYMDIKHHDADRHVEVTGTRLPLVLENAAHLANSSVPHVFRIPVVPGVNDSVEDADGFARVLGEHGIESVELVPFHQFGKGKYTDLDRCYRFADVPALAPGDLAGYRTRLHDHGITTTVSD